MKYRSREIVDAIYCDPDGNQEKILDWLKERFPNQNILFFATVQPQLISIELKKGDIIYIHPKEYIVIDSNNTAYVMTKSVFEKQYEAWSES